MKIEYTNWSTDIFQGFYNSNLYDDDMLYCISQDEEKEYDFVDGGWKSFTENTARKITDLLNGYCRAGLIHKITFKELYSPRFYNFDTDRLILEVDCDWKGLVDYCYETSSDFDKYLQDNFRSRSGFISFVPDNITDFFNKLDDDFDRLSQVVIEYYLLNRIDDIDEYHLETSEIAQDELWNNIAPAE